MTPSEEGYGCPMNHLQIGSGDVAASRGFYERFFGFREAFRQDDILFLRSSTGFLLAIRELDAPANLPPWLHMGFCMPDASEVKTLYAAMRADGVRFARDLAEGDGWCAFYCVDPGGFQIEVSWDGPGTS